MADNSVHNPIPPSNPVGIAQPGGNPQSVTSYVDTRELHKEADQAHAQQAAQSPNKLKNGLVFKHTSGVIVQVTNDLGPGGVQWHVIHNSGVIAGAITGQTSTPQFERDFQSYDAAQAAQDYAPKS